MSQHDGAESIFVRLYPELERMAFGSFRSHEPVAREELAQNTVALAWKMFAALAADGRADESSLRSCLWYAVRQTKSGRTVCRASNRLARDAYDGARTGRVTFDAIELGHFVADETPVPDRVAFRLDVPRFLASLSDRHREIALDLMDGAGTGECAARLGVTPAAISQARTRIRDLYEKFMAG